MNNIKRNSSIELLRIIAEIGVIVLHYNDGIEIISSKNLYLFSESLFICAVNLFIIISGYFLSSYKERKLSKVTKLAVEMTILRTSAYLLKSIINKESIEILMLIYYVLPTNYFVILYIVLYLISPYINLIIEKLDKKQFNRLILLFFVLFSVWPFFVDVINAIPIVWRLNYDFNNMSSIGLFGSQSGYTIINFILMYLIGGYIRKNEITVSNKKKILFLIISIIVEYSLSFISRVVFNYNNPIVIVIAVIIFLIFKDIEFENKLINKLSKSVFTCYICHSYFVNKIHIDSIISCNIFLQTLYLLLVSILIYLICYVIHIIYCFIAKPINKIIDCRLSNIDIYY